MIQKRLCSLKVHYHSAIRLHMKIICRRFHIKTPFTFWDMRTWNMWKVSLQTFINNRICEKLAYFLRILRTSRANNSRILRIKNAKFSGYCFYMNRNIYGDFQICISVPLTYCKNSVSTLFILNLDIASFEFTNLFR